MTKTAAPDTLVVDGDKLKQARVARNLSQADIAASVTLSREQVRALEEGGNLPFYSASHKLLALRKLATALGLTAEALLIAPPTPPNPPAASALPSSASAGNRRTAASAGSGRARGPVIMAAALAMLLFTVLVMALLVRDRPDAEDRPADVAGAHASSAERPQAATSGDAPLVPAAATGSMPSLAPATDLAPVEARAPSAPATSGIHAAAPAAECTLGPTAGAIPVSPSYQRKDDERIFLSSRLAIELCIADAAGRVTLLALAPASGRYVAGKPPYMLHARGLEALDIYMQGMRVRVPDGATLIKLLPTHVPPPSTTLAVDSSD